MADCQPSHDMDRELEELLASHRDTIAYPEMADSASKARARIENAARPAPVGSPLDLAPLDGWNDEDLEEIRMPLPVTQFHRRLPGKLRQIATLAAAALAIFIVGGLLIAVLPDVIDGDDRPGAAVLGPDTTGYEFAGTLGSSMIPNEPVDVAVDSKGNIYAADIATRSVHKFDSNGTFLASWTAEDAEAGPFIRPWSLVIQDDIVYVLDQRQAAVYQLDTEGNTLSSSRIGDPSDSSLLLSGMDVNQYGYIYVANSNAGSIVVYDNDGTRLANIQVADDPMNGGQRPLGIAVDDSGTMYVTGFGGDAIRVYDRAGNQTASWTGISIETNSGGGLYGLTIAPSGELYVNSERGIVKLGPDGSALDSWSIDGWIGSRLAGPGSIAVGGNGAIVIPDTLNQRIIAMSQSGDTGLEIVEDREGRFSMPGGITFDDEGSIYVVDSSAQLVTKFAPDGTLLNSWSWEGDSPVSIGSFPGDVAVTEDYLYILDGIGEAIVKLTLNGEKVTEWAGEMTGPDMWQQPRTVHVDAHGDLYVTNRGDAKILKYDADGRFLEEWDRGGGGTERQQPVAMDVLGNTVYVAYVAGSMPGIWKLELNGNVVEQVVAFSNTGGTAETLPAGLAVAPTGDLFTLNPFSQTVRWYAPDGALKLEWELPSSPRQVGSFVAMAVSDTGTIYISDSETRQVLVYEPVT